MGDALNLRRTIRALWRRWYLIVGGCMLGVALGVALTLVQKPVYIARSAVLLPSSPLDERGRPVRSIDTEARVAASAAILVPVTKDAVPWLSVVQLRDAIRVKPLSNDILEVSARADSAKRSVLIADAVAKQYVVYTNGTSADTSNSTVSVLQKEADDLDKRIRQLDIDIASGTARLAALDQRSAEAIRQAALLDSQRSASVDTARQLALVKGKIAEARLNAELSSRGTRLLQPAFTPQRPARPRPEINVGVGGFIGAVVSFVLVLALYARDERLRTRDGIADAVGAPVIASLAVPTRGAVRVCRSLIRHWEPTMVEALALRHAFYSIGVTDAAPPANLIIATLPGDRPGARTALQCALYAAAAGTPTRLVVATKHSTAADLRVVIKGLSDGDMRPLLHAETADGRQDELEASTNAALTITLIVVEGDDTVVPTWGQRTTTTLAVSSGASTAEALAVASMGLLNAGHPVRGIFVANPDPTDRTSGQRDLPTFVRDVGASLPTRHAGRRGEITARSTQPSGGLDNESYVDLEIADTQHSSATTNGSGSPQEPPGQGEAETTKRSERGSQRPRRRDDGSAEASDAKPSRPSVRRRRDAGANDGDGHATQPVDASGPDVARRSTAAGSASSDGEQRKRPAPSAATPKGNRQPRKRRPEPPIEGSDS